MTTRRRSCFTTGRSHDRQSFFLFTMLRERMRSIARLTLGAVGVTSHLSAGLRFGSYICTMNHPPICPT